MMRPDDAGPLLRSPPFPWIPQAVAAVSAGQAPPGDAVQGARFDRLVDMIRIARIGGSFWAPPMDVPAGPAIVLRPRDAAEAQVMATRARALAGADDMLVANLPAAGWAAETTRMLEANGVRVSVGEIDPWSVLQPGGRLLADARDEWCLLATIIGVTHDHADDARAALADAIVGAVAYRDCFTGRPIDAEAAVAILAGWRRTCDANRAIAVATGMAWWKRQAVTRFLWTGRPQALLFTDDRDKALRQATVAGGGIAAWPSRMPARLAEDAAGRGVPLITVEDGFIRSIGLGADLHPPCSIVVDRGGIYYDPARASDLERILAEAPFPPDLVARAARIRRTIVERGISKYASEAPALPAKTPPRGRRTVLVAGQVEDDMSVRLGGGAVAGNLDLLIRARAAEPEANILFKPHPDVDAGHRLGRVADTDILAHADEVVRDEAMPALLARIDAVHVLTSLTGFEALLRGIEVVVHGKPFFAGWGLTRDMAGPIVRRTRRLTLDQLVAGALILYPRYLDPETGLPCPPEILLDRFSGHWKPRITWVIRARGLQGRLAKLFGGTSR